MFLLCILGGVVAICLLLLLLLLLSLLFLHLKFWNIYYSSSEFMFLKKLRNLTRIGGCGYIIIDFYIVLKKWRNLTRIGGCGVNHHTFNILGFFRCTANVRNPNTFGALCSVIDLFGFFICLKSKQVVWISDRFGTETLPFERSH